MKFSFRKTAVTAAFIALALLLNGNGLFAQSLDRAWQLQNPSIYSDSEVIGMRDDGGFLLTLMSMTTPGRVTVITGTYFLKGNRLTLKPTSRSGSAITTMRGDKDILVFDVVWINNDLAYFYPCSYDGTGWSSNGSILQMAMMNSSEDHYLYNYQNNAVPSYTPGGSSYQNKPQTCYTCNGLLSCPVCKGTRRTLVNYGLPSSPCSACNATGKCWHCNGSGKQ